jgi:hypothetical protein
VAEERRLISSMEVLGDRCLEYVQVRLRPLAILVGPNGSGKSSFLDAPHLVRDLLRDGPAEAVAARADELEDLTWMRRGTHFEIALEVELPERLAQGTRSSCRYAVRIGRTAEGEVGVLEEYLWLKPAREAVAGAGPVPSLRPRGSGHAGPRAPGGRAGGWSSARCRGPATTTFGARPATGTSSSGSAPGGPPWPACPTTSPGSRPSPGFVAS